MPRFHCTNKMNVQAICGAGIAGIEASLAGVASSGAGAYLACTEGKLLGKDMPLPPMVFQALCGELFCWLV